MKKILIIVLVLIFASIVFSIETGQYKYFQYGVDFNFNESVVDGNGHLDTDFSSDCNLSAKREADNAFLLDNNVMLNDAVLLGNYYLTIPASDTTTWSKGKYIAVMSCQDGSLFGAENVSFILDENILGAIQDANKYLGGIIIDSNAIGKGLNNDQNKLLYDLNSLLDFDYPIIVFNSPKNNSSTTSKSVSVSFFDDSDLVDVNILLNGVASSVFDDNDCLFYGTNKNCAYTETGIVLNAYNDLNVVVKDKKGYSVYLDVNFFYAESASVLSYFSPFSSLGSGQIFKIKNFDKNVVIPIIFGEKGYFDVVLENTSAFFVNSVDVSVFPATSNISFGYNVNQSLGYGKELVVRVFYDFNGLVDKNFTLIFDSGLGGADKAVLGVSFVPKEALVGGLFGWLRSKQELLGLFVPIWLIVFVVLLGALFWLNSYSGLFLPKLFVLGGEVLVVLIGFGVLVA